MATTNNDKIVLNVPFYLNKLVKKLGAYYDWRTKEWYVYSGMKNLDRFARFMPATDEAPTA